MRTTLLLLALLSGPVFAAGQTVWKWVDANGVTHYTDRPVPGATRMELSTGSSIATNPVVSGSSTSSAQAPTDSGPVYSDFEIWKPANDETIQNTGGQVTVELRVAPDVQAGHTLSLYLDGRLVEGQGGNATSFDLRDVARGGHTLVAVITDQRGNRIQESARVAFYVQQQSIQQPPVGPALRPPPPKPQPRAGNKMQKSQPTYAALNPPEPDAPKIDPVTNRPVTKAAPKPSTPKSGS